MANQQTFNIQCEVHLVEMHFILRVENDTQTGIPSGIPEGAMCVQRFDDSQFCNSHYLSQFAAFFIDARTKRSVVESFK